MNDIAALLHLFGHELLQLQKETTECMFIQKGDDAIPEEMHLPGLAIHYFLGLRPVGSKDKGVHNNQQKERNWSCVWPGDHDHTTEGV